MQCEIIDSQNGDNETTAGSSSTKAANKESPSAGGNASNDRLFNSLVNQESTSRKEDHRALIFC